MNKKRKIMSVVAIVLVVFGIVEIYYYDDNEHPVLIDCEKQTKFTSSISMMLETGSSSGVYEASTDTEWPGSGYTLNETLSKCENGSSLSWDSDNNAVIVTGNVSDKCYIYFDVRTLAQICSEKGYTMSQCIINEVYSVDGENSLYYFDGEGDYDNSSYEVDDYSYRYTGKSNLEITDLAVESGYSTIANTSADETTGFVLYRSNGEEQYVGYASYLGGYYHLDYDENGYLYSTYYDVVNQAISDGYIKIDVDVNNYVCFGSNDDDCPQDSLYRIIGVFQNNDGEYEVKLIKADYASSTLLGTDGDYYSNYLYYWNYTNSSSAYSGSGYYNDWSYSQLNTVNLNTNYLNNIGSEWSDLIVSHIWVVGGNTSSSGLTSTSNIAYSYEITNPVTSQVSSTYSSKVGLIYVSDYAYGAVSDYWNTEVSSYNTGAIYNYNWLSAGYVEWTITRVSTAMPYQNLGACILNFAVYCDNGTSTSFCNIKYAYVVRPTFYLNSSVVLASGSGTYDDPYRLEV